MKDIEQIIEDWHRRYSLNLTVSLEDLKEQIEHYVIKARIEREETYGVVLENILMNMSISLVKTEISQNKERIAKLNKEIHARENLKTV